MEKTSQKNTKNDTDTIVSSSFKIGSGTSFPQEAFYYYIKQIDPTAINRAMIEGMEVDIYLPSLNIGIEYDGVFYHSGKKEEEKEKKKNRELKEYGIKLIRVKERKGDSDEILYEEKDSITTFIYSVGRRYKYLQSIIIATLTHIFGECSISVNPLDTTHELAILESYRYNLAEMSLAASYPNVAKEWHPTKNGNLKPNEVYPHSHYKAWWVCKYGHEWEASVDSRARGYGCPICAGKIVLEGFNDLQTKNPELAKEWHPTKNGELKPTQVTASSNKKVWWRCKLGHEWKATVTNRSQGTGCPYCSGRKVLIGFNDLKSQYPKIAEEWHPTKNLNLKPSEVTTSSNKKVWWRCKLGHEWQTRIADRTSGKDCPICSGRIILEGFNDLQTKNPELSKEWHPTKNGDLKPTQVGLFSDKKVWWRCKEGHEWEVRIATRAQGNGCPYCAGQKAIKGFNDLQTKNPELAKEWHPTKNGELKPSDVMSASNKKVWWRCKQGHEWKARIADRTGGYRCPICSGKKVLAGFNDLQTKNPKLAKEWHPTKNEELKPTEFTQFSHKIVWWRCKEGHEWEARIADRSRGGGCPECRKRNRMNK